MELPIQRSVQAIAMIWFFISCAALGLLMGWRGAPRRYARENEYDYDHYQDCDSGDRDFDCSGDGE